MRRLLAICLLALPLAACGSENGDDTREVDKQERGGGIVPTGAIDEAIRTEAITHMNTIGQQVRLQAVKLQARGGGELDVFYQSITGRLDAAKLQRMDLTEAQLTGRHYRPGDYTIAIDGKVMTIEASQRGTRGRVEPRQFQLP